MRATTHETNAAPKGPWFVPALLVELAVLVIPGGSRRTRYEQEFEAEFYGMTPGRQTTHAVGILAFAWSLRRATAKPHHHERRSMVTVMKGKPLLCLLNLNHDWHEERTEDGQAYERCRKCGKDSGLIPLFNPEKPGGAGYWG